MKQGTVKKIPLPSLNAQQQNWFDHELKCVDGIDRMTNRGFRNRLYGDDERHAVLG